MAINVDTVYKTVLLVLNKEQRGYITPDEFNRTATQVQLDIFEQYFDDLNQQLRVPQSDYDYSDRQMNIDENISPFKTSGNCVYNVDRFNLPVLDSEGNTVLNSGAEGSGPWEVAKLPRLAQANAPRLRSGGSGLLNVAISLREMKLRLAERDGYYLDCE